ncbi:PREDICTED: uncharacterized protein LOC109337796 [Lupinus angustifolius]|uniref:uncharacterized protein LOC109337796 n=1 Tax=Lupinus angustifolius TaxID=3871 RepID=UPI00092E9A3F|nr:PREDICTED: uncharacterized protein LOC109337796 [Lupinus angustifolius]
MGCCTSKPENHSLENHFHNKLVISPTSSSNCSSFTCTNKSNSIASSSSLSSASSSLTYKDRPFSNEFLWSCYKENPHINGINSLKDATYSFSKPKAPSQAKPSLESMKQSLPQKRVRSNSPVNQTRQKSFRKEVPDHQSHNYSSYNALASGMLRSPSPTRRLNGSKSLPNPMNGSKNNATHSHYVSSSTRKVIIKPTSTPNNSSRRVVHSGLRHREKCSHRNNVSNKIDETMVEEVMCNMDIDNSGLVEDIDNPLVSFDCFIFL